MACKIFKYTVVFFLLLSLRIDLNAQSIQKVESEYEILKSTLTREKLILDSLYKSLESRATLIDEEKRKPKPNEDKIYKLMAGSVTISNSVELQQTKIIHLEKTLEETRQMLDYHYTALIDSLKASKQTSLKMSDVRDIDRQILSNTEKRLLIAPRIKQLSFIPEKILEIDLNKTLDTLQRNIYVEYLTIALNEVNTHLNQVNETSSEIAQIITLQKKASKFLEDVEFESQIKSVGTSSTSPTPADANIRLSGEKDSYFGSTLESYISLNNQLSFRQSPYIHTTDERFLKFKNEQISLKEYLEVLNELKKRLNDYRIILSEKLSTR